MFIAGLQHFGDLTLIKPKGWLHRHFTAGTRLLLHRTHLENAVRIDPKSDLDSGGTRHHGGYPCELKLGEGATIFNPLALTLDDVNDQPCLSIPGRRKFLRARHRNSAVTIDDALDEPTVGFEAE